ncbi:MAG: carboxypeptidase regulatory-like domain-containing protein, partial [Acidobacteria bacterium]|nr:carboxypeptidase regulatory-like domain-containing protein [Acidobacteriota bacterium]
MKRPCVRLFLFLLFILYLTMSSSLVSAQSTGSILGSVVDSSGAAIAGASVTITETGTNTRRVLTTDNSGRFVANVMQIGRYSVKVTAPNFQPAEKSDIVLEAQAAPEINFTLSPSTVSEKITVEASPVAVESTNAALTQVVHSEQVTDLPLNGRNFVELATLAPGVSTGDQPADFFSGGAQSGSETSIRGSFSLSVAGSRENRTDWLYDGVDNGELTSGALGVVPSIDALQEFNVLTSNYSIQYGTRAGPTVLLISKSGTNQFHGTLYDFLRNTKLNASSYFSPINPEYIRNQFGGSIGGPIRKDKTFFFFDYEGTRNVQGLPSLAQVPTALERQGNFTESFPGAPQVPIYDPATTHMDPATGLMTRDQFPGNIIPQNRINPIAEKMLTYLPLPNVPGVLSANYVDVPRERYTDNKFDIRIDNTFSPSDRAFARFSRDQASVYVPSGLPGFGSQPGGYQSNQTLDNHGRNLAISETHIFASNKINQFTAGYNRIFDHIISYGDGTNWSQQLLDIPNANLGTYFSSGFLNTQFNEGYWGLGDRGFSPIQDGTNVFHYSDDFEWVRGPHSFSMGMGVRFYQLNELGDAFPMGEMSFDNLFTAGFSNGSLNGATGNPIASFLLGLPAGGEHDNEFAGEVSGRRWKEFRPYFQDNWRMRPNLSLQLGLAWNYTTPTVEALNRYSNFDFPTGQLLIAGVNASKTAGLHSYYLGFEPRIGVSFSPFSSKNAIRAGYAVLHDAGWNLGAEGLDLNPPFYSTYSFQTDDITPATTLSRGFPVPVPLTQATLSGNVYSQNTNFRPGMIQQFNLNVQRELPSSIVLTAGYMGSRASHLQTAMWNLNTAPPNLQIDPANLRPYPQFNEVIGFIDRGLARYDSLQIKAEKAYHSGLYMLISYAYSKGFDNGLDDDLGSLVGAAYYPLQPPRGTSDKGLSVIDQTHNLSASVLYRLPFGRGARFAAGTKGVTEALIGGWQVNVISHIGSGFPLGMVTGVNNSGTELGYFGNRPNQVCSGKLSHPSVAEFFNTACFPDPAAGVLGDAYRTPLYGPDFVNFDASLFKAFRVYESSQLEFRAEVFNIANHPQFANPGTFTDSPGFGQITQIVNNPRLIQLALKF